MNATQVAVRILLILAALIVTSMYAVAFSVDMANTQQTESAGNMIAWLCGLLIVDLGLLAGVATCANERSLEKINGV